MSGRLKFGAVREGFDPDQVLDEDHIPHVYPRVFERQANRIKVSLPSGHVDLLLRLASKLAGPFRILYVLVVPRGPEPGRYELVRAIDYEELEQFLNRYRLFFEEDGRHDVWVFSEAEESILVYDRHEILWLYGPLSAFEPVLEAEGFAAGTVTVPSPHFHSYKQEFDVDQNSIVGSDEFVWKPLRESDSY